MEDSAGLHPPGPAWLSRQSMLTTNRMLPFTKMNGAGNDFVLLDNRAGDLALTRDQIARLCDRHRGVGADGVLLLEPASNGADFRMRYYNADGGEAEMCGNGARCFARYADRIAGPLEKVSFETPAGLIGAQLIGETVRLQMSEPAAKCRSAAKNSWPVMSTAGCRTWSSGSRKSSRSMFGR